MRFFWAWIDYIASIGIIITIISSTVARFSKSQEKHRWSYMLAISGSVIALVVIVARHVNNTEFQRLIQRQMTETDLSDVQIALVACGIDAYNDTNVHMFLDPPSPESIRINNKLTRAFNQARWRPVWMSGGTAGQQNPVDGVVIEWGAKNEKMHRAALTLLKSLTRKSIGLAAKAGHTHGTPIDPNANWIEVSIGQHPFSIGED